MEQQTAQTIATIHEHLQLPEVLPSAKVRCHDIIEAVRGQLQDIYAVITPVLAGVASTTTALQLQGVPPLLTYIHYLYRDWGWPAEPEGENERVFGAVKSVLKDRPIGRMLVLGAGACRLAYDLHLSDPEAETVVVDIDPFLFTTAQAVVRGRSLTLREANLEIHELDAVVKEWILKAPHGPIDEDQFHFLLADGLAAPFAAETFDTILTPWFIDIVPLDLRNLIGEVYRLLRGAGRWLNIGPLDYRSDVPVERRFSRQEVLDLAARAGFRVDSWRTESMPYLVSKLNGRGKVEWIFSFSATKLAMMPREEASDDVPAWLLFPHIAIPTFAGQSIFRSEDPAEQIVAAAINGQNTVDDIASLLASTAGETGLTTDQFREVVRRCLSEIHPGLKANKS